MNYRLSAPKKIDASLKLPPSKSISNRALLLKALCSQQGTISNLAQCDDTAVMLNALSGDSDTIDIGASGTAMRFLTAYFALKPGSRTITGSHRMQHRPIGILVEALTAFGAKIEYAGKHGFPPLHIQGRALDGGEIMLDGSLSSQFISALLMIAPLMQNGLIMHIEGEAVSMPYINLTLKMMEEYGVKANRDGNTISIYPQIYHPQNYGVEADWTAASYWFELAALFPQASLLLEGLKENSSQGDAVIVEMFNDFGVSSAFQNGSLRLEHTGKTVKKFFRSFIDQPDLAQTAIVTACALKIPFLCTGLQTLTVKETDRLQALQKELKKLGYIVQIHNNNAMEWDGKRCKPANEKIVINTFDDHRMAMAFAPLSVIYEDIGIDNPQVVAKSYPDFWEELKKMGFNIKYDE